MTHNGKCRFCKSTDHNLSKCNDKSMDSITNFLEKNIYSQTIYDVKNMNEIFLFIYEEIIDNEYKLESLIQLYIIRYKEIIINIFKGIPRFELSILAKKFMIPTSYPKSIHITSTEKINETKI